jgi:hypothetical protein
MGRLHQRDFYQEKTTASHDIRWVVPNQKRNGGGRLAAVNFSIIFFFLSTFRLIINFKAAGLLIRTYLKNKNERHYDLVRLQYAVSVVL